MRQPSQTQDQLNKSIEQVRGMMQQIQNSTNPEAMLQQMLLNNPNTPALANLLKNGNNLEGLAKSMAQAGGFNLQEIIKGLTNI